MEEIHGHKGGKYPSSAYSHEESLDLRSENARKKDQELKASKRHSFSIDSIVAKDFTKTGWKGNTRMKNANVDAFMPSLFTSQSEEMPVRKVIKKEDAEENYPANRHPSLRYMHSLRNGPMESQNVEENQLLKAMRDAGPSSPINHISEDNRSPRYTTENGIAKSPQNRHSVRPSAL